MKKLMIATAFMVAATQATAGGMTEPLVEQEVVMAPEQVAQGVAGSGGFIVPLLILAVVALAVSTTGGGGGGTVPKVPEL